MRRWLSWENACHASLKNLILSTREMWWLRQCGFIISAWGTQKQDDPRAHWLTIQAKSVISFKFSKRINLKNTTWRILEATPCQSIASTCTQTYMYISTYIYTGSYSQHANTKIKQQKIECECRPSWYSRDRLCFTSSQAWTIILTESLVIDKTTSKTKIYHWDFKKLFMCERK